MTSDGIIVGIDYDEGDIQTYRGVRIAMDGLEMRVFSMSGVISDFETALNALRIADPDCAVLFSSTVDTFVWECGGEYVWRIDDELGEVICRFDDPRRFIPDQQ